jgi:hypothetical protein
MLSHEKTVFSRERQMPDYIFFRKGEQIAVLERSEAEKAPLLTDQGYEKQYEEIDAPNAEHALARYADIRKEERTTEDAFITGTVFSTIVTAILR